MAEPGPAHAAVNTSLLTLAPARLSAGWRTACGAVGATVLGVGMTAVFQTDNEAGTAGTLLIGAVFAIAGVLGRFPRLKFGDNEIDPGLAYVAGVEHGADEVIGRAEELTALSPDAAYIAEALEERKADLTNAELRHVVTRSAVGPSSSSTSSSAAKDRIRQIRESAEAAGLIDAPTQVIDILSRFKAFDPSTDPFGMAAYLQDLRFEVYPPQSRKAELSDRAYLRWIFEGEARTVRLYQNSAGLISDSKPQFGFASTLPGGDIEGGAHPRVRYYYSPLGRERVELVARAFRDYANGQDQPSGT